MPEEISTEGPITASFSEPDQLRSRDIFRLLSRAWPFIRPYRRDLVRLFVMLLPGAAAGLFALLVIRVVFDVIGNSQPLTPSEAWLLRLPLSATRQMVLLRVCLAGGAAALISLPYVLFVFGYAVWILQKISNRFRVNLYVQLQELSLNFHSEEKIGDAIFRMFQDSAGIPHVINGLLMQPLRALPLAIANLGWLAVFNYGMCVVALILIPAEFALAWTFSASLRTAFLRAREASAHATTRIEETLASIKAVKAFGREDHEATVYGDENWAALIAERKARIRLLIYRVLSNLLRGLGYLAVVYIGAQQVVTGHGGGLSGSAISLGLFQATVIAFDRIAGSSHELAMIWGSLQDVGVGFARVFQILRQQSDRIVAAPRASRDSAPLPALKQTLACDRVSFGYLPGLTVLRGVDFEAHAGELTAMVGPSGAGKSTLIALLLRFFDPACGRILLDGRDIREFDVGNWRQMIAVGLQNNPLMTGTLRDNVAYGRPEASPEEIRAALGRVGLGDFVDSLPEGLNTVLGERGAKLSTGQAQRVGVARALLRDSSILLLDEPSSALDVANEERLMRGLRAWLADRPGQRLAIIMTHRRTAAAWADRVYSMTSGGLTERSDLRDSAAADAGNV
jgi:ABC-type multidrug transport system fused ATPase/permease subunit